MSGRRIEGEKGHDVDVLDRALNRLERCGPEFNDGFSNHGPMVAEVLVTLGRPDAVLPWVDGYIQMLEGCPVARTEIGKEDFRQALGDFDRFADWVVFFNDELDHCPWQDLLAEWTPRLAPGVAAGATHGLIQTAHAVRSIARRETPQRRRELARGLAYWAARYQELPGEFSGKNGDLLPSQAIEHVELLPEERRQPFHLIVERLADLEGFEPFAHVMDLVDTSGDPSAFISDLTKTFAYVYLTHAVNHDLIITFIHTVTAPSALRLVAPYLDRETISTGLRFAWQTCAALYAGFGFASTQATFDPPDEDVEELVTRSIATRHVHVIKFTEVCLREHAIAPDPVYLAAAWDAVERLGGVESGPHVPAVS